MKTLLKFGPNYEGRDFVIGDLHGCYELLMERMDEVLFDKTKDRIFAVGDLVDRGPNSMKCLKLLFEPWFHSVRGNHEDMMFKGTLEQDAESFQCWIMNGGAWHLEERAKDIDVFDTFMTTCRMRMPLAIEVELHGGDHVGILHADAPKTWDEESIKKNVFNTLWGRDRWSKQDASLVEGITHIYVGHTPNKGIQQYGNVFYIDTGACFEEKELTMLDIS